MPPKYHTVKRLTADEVAALAVDPDCRIPSVTGKRYYYGHIMQYNPNDTYDVLMANGGIRTVTAARIEIQCSCKGTGWVSPQQPQGETK